MKWYFIDFYVHQRPHIKATTSNIEWWGVCKFGMKAIYQSERGEDLDGGCNKSQENMLVKKLM